MEDRSPLCPNMHIELAEALPSDPTPDVRQYTWKYFNRLRTGVVRTKSVLKKMGAAQTHSEHTMPMWTGRGHNKPPIKMSASGRTMGVGSGGRGGGRAHLDFHTWYKYSR